MLKMIVADDEPVIIKGIKKLVDWKGLGIEIVGEYEDGKAALDGILLNQPDIALLDIYMPKKTGIDILKDLKQLEIRTKVIFISGFQDFQYAKDALAYGAVNYLLKPVIREELVNTMEQCIADLLPEKKKPFESQEGAGTAQTSYEGLVEVEDCVYQPVVAKILEDKPLSPQEQKLLGFSVLSFLEDYLAERDQGIVFVKNGHMVLVLKNPDEAFTGQLLTDIYELVGSSMNCRLGFLVGEKVSSMGEIPRGYEACLSMEGCLYFAGQNTVPVFWFGKEVHKKTVTLEELKESRERLWNYLTTQDDPGFFKELLRLKHIIYYLADGRRDDACFYYGTTARGIEEELEAMGLKGPGKDLGEMLLEARRAKSYDGLAGQFEVYFTRYKELVKNAAIQSDKKDIIHAREYIEQHYMENLSLEVLAGEIHMNPYYFSSFFKKASGENFKDYLNKVRLKHAVTLLLSTDKKASEIAACVGFRDSRSFAEIFSRSYGETPSVYRKRVRGKDS